MTSAFDGSGAVAESDPILRMIVADSDTKAPTKIVDVDPEQQLVSMLYGLEVRIADRDGHTLLRGQFEPAPFDDIWARIQGSGPGGDANAGAKWQSVLRDLEWGDISRSPFLQELRVATKDGLLSIKFNVDRYSMAWKGDVFCSGRIVGTIGPASADEPAHLVIGRQFLAQIPVSNGFPSPVGQIYSCVGVLDEVAGKVRIDLGNALPTTYEGNTLHDIGPLSLVCDVQQDRRLDLGSIDYLQPGWYERTAGIVELPADRQLTTQEIALLKDNPLALLTSSAAGLSVAIAEPPDGKYCGVDQFVFRLSPGQQTTVHLQGPSVRRSAISPSTPASTAAPL